MNSGDSQQPMLTVAGTVFNQRAARAVLTVMAGMAMMVTYVETMVVPGFQQFYTFFQGVPYSTIAWIISAYLLVGTVATPIFGKLGDRFGKKRVLIVVMTVYLIAVSVAGFTPNIGEYIGVSRENQVYLLITARAIQGVGMAMFPLAYAMMPEVFPESRVAPAQGTISAMFGAGAALGLIGGGYITETYGWQTTFHTVGIACHKNGNTYVADKNRIEYFELDEAGKPPGPPKDVPDADLDGLLNDFETGGWSINVTNTSGTHRVHVSSDPLCPDTDGDDLNDSFEYAILTDPRSADTDGDGLSDSDEVTLGSDPTSWDTDSDQLGDGFEITFGSDPLNNDTDHDGLDDLEEYLAGTDPMSPDTDGDGLTDAEELAAGTDPRNSDSDGDLLLDGQEVQLGTDPVDPDSDSDGLSDGYEVIYKTDPKNNDTDGDLLADGEEVLRHTNPVSNDTDEDGLSDSEEIEMGTNPLLKDSDGDRIIDSDDNATKIPMPDDVVVCIDFDSSCQDWVDEFGGLVNTTVVSPDDLMDFYSQARYVVIVGDMRDDPATAGGIIRELLSEELQGPADMVPNPDSRMVVRHGLWTPHQTVVVLRNPVEADLYAVITALKEADVTIKPGLVVYETTSTTKLLRLEGADTVSAVGASAMIALGEPSRPTVTFASYDDSDTPHLLNQATGLAKYEQAMGLYFEMTVTDPSSAAGADVQNLLLRMFYTDQQLDRTGDGDADDMDDIDEGRLVIYVFDESSQEWERLSDTLPWVVDTGVNTTDLQLHGTNYSGYAWAMVRHTSLFAMAGSTYNRPPDVSQAYASVEFLWAPNHKFVDVHILGVTDPDGDDIAITILGVTSDEPTSSQDGKGDVHAPDAYGIGTSTASLRSERLDTNNGRVYEITFVASDGRGGETVGTVKVFVPHDYGKHGSVCVDDGQKYDATAIN